MSKALNVNNSLYEIAISIGNSLVLEDTLKESLTTSLHKLNGIAIAVLKDEDEILYSIPRRKFNYIRAKNIKHINHCTKQLVYEFYHDGQYFYCFTLHAGHLLIVKKK